MIALLGVVAAGSGFALLPPAAYKRRVLARQQGAGDDSMSESAVFERTCAELEQATSFDNLSARGTIRLALKSAGLDAQEVTTAQMLVVVKRVLPAELKARGVKDSDNVCSVIASRIAGIASAAMTSGSSAEDVFRRLGGA